MNKKISDELIIKTNDDVNEQIEHLLSTMDEFRSFFRPNQKLRLSNPRTMIKSVLKLLNDDLIANNIEAVVIGEKNSEILCIENEFKHIFINLISNSKDAFNENNIEKRKIIFEIKKDENSCEIQSFDNAGGIPNGVIQNVFKSNFTTKKEGEGTGIGMFLCKQIIEKINGNIKVENINDGASFIISIKQ